jgi:hypothetical protein|tara:strand:+ start:442 stop:684 length:243 start_codon:yes stop_codon:yes gene_type:complete
MIHWLQSLSENGFDVFIVVYLAVLHLVYHYLMRWYIKSVTKDITDTQKIVLNTLYMMNGKRPSIQEYMEFEKLFEKQEEE